MSRFTGSASSHAVFKNMGILASGSAVGKMLSLGTYPVITRLYTPQDFGVLSVFTSVIAIIVPFATLRYSVTIPLPKNDGLAFNLVVLSAGLVLGISILLGLFFITAGDAIFGFLNMAEIADYWWLLILGVGGAAFYELFSNWATRKKNFAPVAKTTVWQSFLASSSKIGLGWLGVKPWGLLIGTVLGHGGGVISLLKSFLQDFRVNLHSISASKIALLTRYYKDLPLYRLPSQFLLVFSTKIPVLYFAFQYGSEPTGQLGLALVMVAIPMNLIGTNTGKAYYAEIARIGPNRKSEILALTKSITKKLSLLSLAPTLVLVLFAPLLFQLVFGSEWEQAGVFTSILAFYLFVQFVTSPLVNVFNVYNQQRKFLEINAVRIMLMGVVFTISYFMNLNVYETITLYTVIISLHYIFTGYQIFKIIR